jgi:hypothetical protein
MYQAELRGKLSVNNEEKEDILTSNVFSFFKYSNREVFLARFLGLLQIQVTKQEAKKARFEFWPHYEDNTEPDVIVYIGPYYLLFEAKFFSDFGKETEVLESQIKRELKQGLQEAKNQNKEFLYIPITANYVRPKSILAEAPKNYQKYCRWVNWQKVARLLYSIQNDKSVRLTMREKEFADDLYQLLIKKKLGTYNGISTINQELITFNKDVIFFGLVNEIISTEYFGFFENLKKPAMKIIKHGDVFLARKLFAGIEGARINPIVSNLFYKGAENG